MTATTTRPVKSATGPARHPATPEATSEREAIEIRKLDLECREILTRITREGASASAISAKDIAATRQLIIANRLKTVVVDRIERDMREAGCDWASQHKYVFAEGASAGGITRAIERLNVWSQLDPGCDIEIIINSPGGDVVAGMFFFDYLRELSRKGHKITTVATGKVASMANIIIQAGDVRVATHESMILLREMSFTASGKIGQVEDARFMIGKLTDHVVRIFVERSGGKLTEAYLRAHWERTDWWLDAEEALALGIIDEIR